MLRNLIMPTAAARRLCALSLGLLVSTDMQAATAERDAQLAGAADGASTALVVGVGAGAEANGLVGGSPVGIMLATAGKVALPVLTRGMAPQDRAFVLKTSTSLYGGAAAWNLCVLAGPTAPICAALGMSAGYVLWRRANRKLEREAITAPEAEAQLASTAQPDLAVASAAAPER